MKGYVNKDATQYYKQKQNCMQKQHCFVFVVKAMCTILYVHKKTEVSTKHLLFMQNI